MSQPPPEPPTNGVPAPGPGGAWIVAEASSAEPGRAGRPRPALPSAGLDVAWTAFGDGFVAGISADVVPVTAFGLVAAVVGLVLASGAWHLGGGEPLRTALLLLVTASGWTWLGAAWARFGVERAVRRLSAHASRPPGPLEPGRRRLAEAAAALAATPPLALLLLAPDLLLRVAPSPAVDLALLLGLGAWCGVALLVLPIGTCALVLAHDLPPLAALGALLRGVRRGWAGLVLLVVAHSVLVVGVVAVSLLLFVPLLLWPVWLPLHGAAGCCALVALALDWAAVEAAGVPPAARFTARPPEPPRWLLPVAGALLRLAFGAVLASVELAAAAGQLALPVEGLAVAAGAIAGPWLVGAGLLHVHQARHRRVVLDDEGLRLDAGPERPGRRVPWSAVRGARVREDGVALRLRWSEVLFRCPTDEIDPLLQWLATRGVRRADEA